MTEKVKIELNEKDLLELVAERFNLNADTAKITIHHYKGDAREPEYTNVVVEGVKTVKPWQTTINQP